MKLLTLIVMVVLSWSLLSCKEKPKENRVDFNQINIDNSNDYNYIFRETIREQEKQRKKKEKQEF